MKIKTLLLAGCFTLLAACDESKYDLEELVPEQYHKILYLDKSGKQALTLYDTEEDNKYTFSVIKAGSNPSLTASVNINLMTQQQVDEKYSNPEAVNYKIISNDCYSLDVTHLDFSANDRYKFANVSLKPQQVKALIESDPTVEWVLPLYVASETDSINAERAELFLQMKDVILPALGFTDTSVELKQYNYGSASSISEKIKINLDTDNKWDLEWELEVDEAYVTSYNNANGTSFITLPAGTYTIPESMTLPNGTNSIELTTSISGDQLEPGDYMLPIRLKNISLFQISSDKDLYPLTIRILGTQFDRTGWSAEASTEEASGEGAGNGVPSCAIDGNPSTYWHTRWNGWSDWPPHELIIDTKKEHTFSQFAMAQRQNDSYFDTRSGEFYVSSDNENWTKVGTFSMERIFDTQIFGVTPTKGRYFMIKILQSFRDPYCSLSEAYAYGME